MPELTAPTAALAADIAARAVGSRPCAVIRFTTGARHYVFDVGFEREPSIVVRIGDPTARTEMAGAVELSRLLRSLGVPLPRLLAWDLDAAHPWLILERLDGEDLGAVAARLSEAQLDRVAAQIARAQGIAATVGSAGGYGYAVRAQHAPHKAWSHVLDAHLARSRRRIAAAGLFDAGLVEIVQDRVEALRGELDAVAPTPFLHDTTTKNVIVTREGNFSGIVDVDDLCFGDPRYPAALTLASMLGYGGPVGYVSAWLRHAGRADDQVFRLYVAAFLLDLMSEHGHAFNGNAGKAGAAARARLHCAFQASLSYI